MQTFDERPVIVEPRGQVTIIACAGIVLEGAPPDKDFLPIGHLLDAPPDGFLPKLRIEFRELLLKPIERPRPGRTAGAALRPPVGLAGPKFDRFLGNPRRIVPVVFTR